MLRSAECACGRAKIAVRGTPSLYGVCHCTNCKRRTGSAFGISSYFKKSDVESTEGELSVYSFHHAVQNHDQARHFCSNCGTTLFWYVSALPELIGISAGCFGEDPPGEPDVSVTHAKCYPWVGLPESWRKVP